MILGSRAAGSDSDTGTGIGTKGVTGTGGGGATGATGATGAGGFICSTINFLRSSNCFITSAVDTDGGGGSCAAFAAKHASHLQPSGRVGVGMLGLIYVEPPWGPKEPPWVLKEPPWGPKEPGFLTKLDECAGSRISVFSYVLSRLSVSYTSYVSFIIVLRMGLRCCIGVLARVFVSCMPPSRTTSSENVGVGAMVTRESFLSIDFGVCATAVAFGCSTFSKSAGSPV